MVALVLGLIMVGGALQLFVSTLATYRTNENLARMQDTARFAFELLMRETRDAGMVPCGSRLTANVLRPTAAGTAPPWWADTDAGTLRGFDDTQASSDAPFGTSANDRIRGTDALVLLRPFNDEQLINRVAAHAPASTTFTMTSLGDLKDTDIVLLCDGKSSALLQIGTITPTGNRVTYAATSPNCTVSLGAVGAQCASPQDKTFDPGAIMVRWDPALWYVGANRQGTRSLYRAEITKNTASGVTQVVTARQELVPGVHDMQIEYLTRNRDTGFTLATRWVGADAFNGGWVQSTAEVIAVRFTLTLRSEETVGTDGKPLERHLVAVAALRNRDL
jgi:type IV pilus assembly protein PilW